MYYVYIIRSKRDKRLYLGSTNDLKRRLAEHNNKLVASTKHRAPFDPVYYEAYRSENEARRRE